MPSCDACKTETVAKTIATKVVGAQPVTLTLCGCDYGKCRACGTFLAWTTKRCGKCSAPC